MRIKKRKKSDTPIEKDRGRVRNTWKGKENYYEEKGLRPCDVARETDWPRA